MRKITPLLVISEMRNTIIMLISALLCAVAAQPSAITAQTATAQSSDNYAEKLRQAEQFIRTEMEKDKIPGLTIGFSQGGYTWVKGFGYADLENRLAAKPESAYRLASITKTFTGVAILQLVEKGKMSLDGEIQTYLPSYPRQAWPVTVRQLLLHTGGGQTGSGLGPEYVTPRQVVERIAKYPIQTEPGTRYLYTTSGYNLLGAAIEEVTGKPFGDYLRENIFDPVGMKETRMNSEREMIPNRVRPYELVNGEIQNARFIDVSSRFGGGGTIGTVPDLLKWARGVDSEKILSAESVRLMYTPAATKGGRYVGPGGADWNDGDGYWYYTLGWLQFPINGQLAIWNDGAQFGTNTALLRVPSKDLVIAFACNLQESAKMKYVKRLYELITDEIFVEPLSPSPVYAGGKIHAAVHKAISETFNYGSLHLERTGAPVTTNTQELAEAFGYFNSATNLAGLRANYQAAAKAINDGRHPAGGDAFLKVGSWMAMQLRERKGAGAFKKYRAMGEIAFFADYIEMYRANPEHPKDMRFATDFENLIMRWGRDWARTWDDEMRRLTITPESDFTALGERLRRAFQGADVYPNFIGQLLKIQSGEAGIRAVKLAVDLYPEHERTNATWGLFLVLANTTEERRAAFAKHTRELGSALDYFRKSLELDPGGMASAKTLNQIARSWLNQSDKLDDAIALLKVAIELHPRGAALHEALGDVYLKKGEQARAIEAFQKALEADPGLEHAREMLKRK